MNRHPFTENMKSITAAFGVAAVLMLIFSIGIMINNDRSQLVSALFICISGLGSLGMFWGTFSQWIILRINKGKDVLVFIRWARVILFTVAILPLVSWGLCSDCGIT